MTLHPSLTANWHECEKYGPEQGDGMKKDTSMIKQLK